MPATLICIFPHLHTEAAVEGGMGSGEKWRKRGQSKDNEFYLENGYQVGM
jgi:hypothetical protein